MHSVIVLFSVRGVEADAFLFSCWMRDLWAAVRPHRKSRNSFLMTPQEVDQSDTHSPAFLKGHFTQKWTVTISSSASCSKPVWVSFFNWTQMKILCRMLDKTAIDLDSIFASGCEFLDEWSVCIIIISYKGFTQLFKSLLRQQVYSLFTVSEERKKTEERNSKVYNYLDVSKWWGRLKLVVNFPFILNVIFLVISVICGMPIWFLCDPRFDLLQFYE